MIYTLVVTFLKHTAVHDLQYNAFTLNEINNKYHGGRHTFFIPLTQETVFHSVRLRFFSNTKTLKTFKIRIHIFVINPSLWFMNILIQ